MPIRRVLKWTIPVDDRDHPIGSGPVVHVAVQGADFGRVQVWTDEANSEGPTLTSARIYGTGQLVPPDDVHIGSTLAGSLVWHAFRSNRRAGGLAVAGEDL